MNKTYNAGAWGIPAELFTQVCDMRLKLEWSRHAKLEAVQDAYGILPSNAYPQDFTMYGQGWELVECEENSAGNVVKFVVRRKVATQDDRSLVLVILRDGPHVGLVKTCWTNLNTDKHATLDKSKYAKLR